MYELNYLGGFVDLTVDECRFGHSHVLVLVVVATDLAVFEILTRMLTPRRVLHVKA